MSGHLPIGESLDVKLILAELLLLRQLDLLDLILADLVLREEVLYVQLGRFLLGELVQLVAQTMQLRFRPSDGTLLKLHAH